MPAARLADISVCPIVTGLVAHGGGLVSGPWCPTVPAGGLPAPRVGDMPAHGGSIVAGMPTVLAG